MLHSSKTIGKLWPVITWKTEGIPNQLLGLAKKISKQNVASVSECLGLHTLKWGDTEELKKELFSLQEEFGEEELRCALLEN